MGTKGGTINSSKLVTASNIVANTIWGNKLTMTPDIEIQGDVHFQGKVTVDSNNRIGKVIVDKFPGKAPTEGTVVALLKRLSDLEKFLDRLGIDV